MIRAGLWLPGYDERSVWGYDFVYESWFVEIWHNAAAYEEGAELIYSPKFGWPAVKTPDELAELIGKLTRTPLAEVTAMMAEDLPAVRAEIALVAAA